jgi:aspartokinase
VILLTKIGGIVENKNLTLYRISSVEDQPGVAGNILRFFAEYNINFEYITESSTVDATAVIAIGIRAEKSEEFDKKLANLGKQGINLNITKIENVSVLGIYGPHFREKPALAAKFCMTLGRASINILGLSSSISSICGIIGDNEIDKAKSALLEEFELP